MRILICPDSFKGTLTSQQAADAIEQGVLKSYPGAKITKLPIADGGEGTVEVLTKALGGQERKIKTIDPLGRHIKAKIGLCKKKDQHKISESVGSAKRSGDQDGICVIEAAQANGLHLLSKTELNPLKASSYGVGSMIEKLLSQLPVFHYTLLIGIGGSCTNDGGIGLAQALGYQFLDRDGKPLQQNTKILSPDKGGGHTSRDRGIIHLITPSDISRLHTILPPPKDSSFIIHHSEFHITVLSDVDNPLLGPNGATSVYGPQKGASTSDVKMLEQLLSHLTDVVKKDLGIDMNKIKGGGAAGGLGAALVVFANATIVPGMEEIAKLTGLEEKIKWADVVITGEGKIDRQTEHEKGPYTIAQMSKSHSKPCIALCGVAETKPKCFSQVFDLSSQKNFNTNNITTTSSQHLLTQLASSLHL